jgi:release factor glutamine methyltransferase
MSEAYVRLLDELASFWQPLPDKPEETPDRVLHALWLAAAGEPASVEAAAGRSRPALTEDGMATLQGLLRRKREGEPTAHLTGRQNFLGVELLAGAGALIPRKETEIVGRAALRKLSGLVNERGHALVVDVCTGSGNLALAYAHHEPKARVFGADLSADCVELARKNAAFTGLADRVEFREGDLLAPFDSPDFIGQCDLVSCNPPYISAAKVPAMAKEISAYEPQLAFNGGAFGISILTKLVRNAPRFLKADSWLCFEMGLGQGELLAQQLRTNPAFAEVETYTDDEGRVRALAARTRQ